jgi:1-phosphatidylinositol-5-phosphate 4-kinase
MRNICSSSLNIHRKYDLKGSTVDREASEKEKGKDVPTFKDNDFTRDGVRIYVNEDWKQRFLEMLEADCAFLVRKNIMDYSLCVAIHDCEKAEQEAMECGANDKLQVSAEEDEGESSGGDQHEPHTVVPTPPDSPETHHKASDVSENDVLLCGTIDISRDIYAVHSSSGNIFII